MRSLLNMDVNTSPNYTQVGGENTTSLPDMPTTQITDFAFVIYVVLLPTVALLGMVGNVLTMVVLWSKRMQSTTTLFLRGLVLTDVGVIVVLTMAITPLAVGMHGRTLQVYVHVIYPHLYGPFDFLAMSVQQCNVWILVSVSVERYIAVCHPLKAAYYRTRRKTIITLVLLTVSSAVYNVPRLFGTVALPTQCDLPELEQLTCYRIDLTELGKNVFYKDVYKVWMYAIVIYLLPLITMSVINVLIIRELIRMRSRRRDLAIYCQQQQKEDNVTLVLVLIMTVFILCQTLAFFNQIDALFDDKIMQENYIAVISFLYVVNSSVNFLIYVLVGKKFRHVLFALCRRYRRRSKFCPARNGSNHSLENTMVTEFPHTALS
ncbi:FMRFamide receptor-like [Mizuhopecten yessoensis]|uniref:FMRFamide receptor n=1 Tax=Mizuhopecten yessoensis TaxID=6573 RepID=A0A210R213_MIZYE|nr:FMRFamide receptor-like [Mizuhopecten yessoensis]OWF55002.1 FMRFamide receptor [Mizuhopecten yessoensis]